MRKPFYSLIYSSFLFLSLIFFNSLYSYAEDTDIKVFLSNKLLNFDVNPTIIEGRTLIPLSRICKELNAESAFDNRNKTITIKKDSKLIKLTIGQKVAYLNDKNIELDVAPLIIKGRVLVPLKFISECLEYKTSWINNSIYINKSYSYFVDKNLENAVCKSLNKPIEQITEADYSSIEFLDASQQNIMMLNGIENLKNLVALNLYDNKVQDISLLKQLKKLREINIEQNQITDYSPLKELNNLTTIMLWGITFPSDVIQQTDFVTNKCKDIINKILTPNMSKLEKELTLHDYLITHSKYDIENYDNNNIPNESHSPYGILLNGTGVCDSYAQVFNILLNMAGIYSNTIIGEAYGTKGWEGHMWNIVQIDGQCFHVDITWDDPIIDNQQQKLRHKYFNISDRQMSLDHKWDLSKYSTCNQDNTSLITKYENANIISENFVYGNLNDGLYKKQPNSELYKITDDKTDFLCVDEDVIYYRNESDGNKLYKINSDSSNKTLISDHQPLYISKTEKGIYYINSNDCAIYKLEKENNEISKCSDKYEIITWMKISGQWIYFKSFDFILKNTFIKRVSLDFDSQIEIIANNISGFEISDDGQNIKYNYNQDVFLISDYMYYTQNSKNSIYKTNVNSITSRIINPDGAQIEEILGNYIYYKMDGDSINYYRIKSDGTCKTIL